MDTKIILPSLDVDQLPDVTVKTPVILPDGREGYIYPDKSIRRGDGAFLVKPHWSNGAFTGDQAREAVKIREQKRRDAVLSAILAGTNSQDIGVGIQILAEQLVKVVLKGSQDRDKIQAFKELMRQGGMAYDLGRSGDGPGPGSGAGGLSPGAIGALNVILPALEKRLLGE